MWCKLKNMKTMRNLKLISIGSIALLIAVVSINALSLKDEVIQNVEAQSTNTDWAQLQHDERGSGYEPNITIKTNTHVNTGGYGNTVWKRDIPEELTGQPIVVGSTLVIPAVSGKVYAINTSDGSIKWSVSTGAGILGSVAITEGKVIVGNFAGKLFALDINNGNTLWTFDGGSGAFSVSPRFSNGTIYIGSEGGVFYAVKVSDGTQKWAFKVGGPSDSGVINAPILSTAAVLGSRVFFGAENMRVYALDTTTGNLLWKRTVYGQSFNHHHLVASSQNGGVIMARTQPIYTFHKMTLNPDDTFLTSATGKNWNGNPLGNLNEWVIEQKAISERLATNPYRRSLWDLDPATGNDKYSKPLPIIYTFGNGDVPAAPIVDDTTNRAWIIGRSVYARFDSGGTVRQYADPLKLNLNFNPNIYTNSNLGESALAFTYFPCNGNTDCKITYEDFHLVGDEHEFVTAVKNALMLSSWAGAGGIDINSGSSFNIVDYGANDTNRDRLRGKAGVVASNGKLFFRDNRGIKAYNIN